MKIDNAFDFGDIVYLKTDIDQRPRVVVAFEVYTGGEMLYKLACSTITSYHYEMEISKEKDILMTTTN